MISDQQCNVCRFYKELNADLDLGFCRRYPPRVVVAAKEPAALQDIYAYDYGSDRAEYPVQPGAEWCGEFKPKIMGYNAT